MVYACFEAQAFADHVGGGEWKDGGGEGRGIEQAESEEVGGEASGVRDEGCGGLGGVRDIGHAIFIQGGGAADDDEEDDHHTRNATDENIEAGVFVLFGADSFFHEAGLEIEELPGSDSGADQGGEHEEVVGAVVQCGRYGFFSREEPIGFREDGRNYVREIETAGYQEYFFDLAITSLHHQEPDGDAR